VALGIGGEIEQEKKGKEKKRKEPLILEVSTEECIGARAVFYIMKKA
jgi:hypothetical protein